jgi:(p)ppGpp synthase/HD superfamily hydrolase
MKDTDIELAKQFVTKKFEDANIKNHFLEVFDILKNEFEIDNDKVLTAGLLHDTLEDTNTTSEEIETLFGKDVAILVEEVSHPKNYTDDQKDEYYKKIISISPEAKMIKLADFTSHLRKFIGSFEGTSDYPKQTTDGYVLRIQSFLENCPESKAKVLVATLANKLDKYIKNI